MAAKRPTLRDVALEAQLSVTQASRALNGHSDVAEATRRRALDAAERLGYTPNLEARRLKAPGTRAHSIGLILPSQDLEFSNPFFGDLVAGIVAQAARSGYEVQLTMPVSDAESIAAYELAIRHKRVDGFIMVRTELDDPRLAYLTDADVPFVALGRPEGATGFPSVEPSIDCMGPAVQHLVDLGHSAPACVAEPHQFSIGATRLRSFLRSVKTHELTNTVIEAGFGEEAGFGAAMELLQGENPPTAIVALNDLLALGVLQAADELDVKVPAQLSVIGFDDITAARLVRPALTTVHQSAHDVGALLVQELIPGIELGSLSGDSVRVIDSNLVIRDSTGPAVRTAA
ncbi:MAG: LacI family DNA-binding transcriptional regulator [Acidimicrobiales bacterium]